MHYALNGSHQLCSVLVELLANFLIFLKAFFFFFLNERCLQCLCGSWGIFRLRVIDPADKPASDNSCTHKFHESSWQIILALKDYWAYIPNEILTLLLT